MGRSETGIAVCPRCDRTVRTCDHRYLLHNEGEAGVLCPMGGMHIPYRADQQSPTDYVGRAHIVANLAAGVQDEDPTVVWNYLTAVPADELQRLLQIALAAIPLDKTVPEIWEWVCALPAARITPKKEHTA